MCEHDDKVAAVLSRRGFLRSSGLVGVGAVAATAIGNTPATAAVARPVRGSHRWRPDVKSDRFTIAVMPDTQYLFAGDAIHPAPLQASLSYILDQQADQNIVFMAHLGDMTENGQPNEFSAISESFKVLDRAGAAYSVLAGNHDIDSSKDDQRGDSPYLQSFGPHRFTGSPSYKGSTPDGYNSYHLFTAGGREWLVLALDWRTSTAGIEWVKAVLAKHPTTPAILTTHDLVSADTLDGKAILGDYGQQLWDDLIRDHDQIFLTLNGHYWPPGRTVLRNAAGHDVHLHITNYQNRYYGGAAMIRLYHFDLARNVVDVETLSPWLLDERPETRNLLAAEEVELSSDFDRFTVPIDFVQRFGGFAPVKPRPARPARSIVLSGTAAYWRFDGGANGSALPLTARVRDLSGNGNDLIVANRAGRQADALTWSDEHHPDQPAFGSVSLRGGRASGDYLRTVAGARLNKATFTSGYTIEAFFKIPEDFDVDTNKWAALLSRWGLSSEAGKATIAGDGDPDEPVATLSLSDAPALQWAIYPTSQDGALTNWGHELPLGSWWHVAVVNDARHTTMYVDGCVVVRNPSTVNRGIATIGREWLIGGYEYAGKLDQVLYAQLGDMRIVDHALPVSKFMIA